MTDKISFPLDFPLAVDDSAIAEQPENEELKYINKVKEGQYDIIKSISSLIEQVELGYHSNSFSNDEYRDILRKVKDATMFLNSIKHMAMMIQERDNEEFR